MDTPPGTSDEHLSIAQYMIPCQLTGAIIVTSPQEISLLDVRKEINFCRKVNIPIIGIVENMSWLVFFVFYFLFYVNISTNQRTFILGLCAQNVPKKA